MNTTFAYPNRKYIVFSNHEIWTFFKKSIVFEDVTTCGCLSLTKVLDIVYHKKQQLIV